MSEFVRVEHLSYVYGLGMPDATTALDDVSSVSYTHLAAALYGWCEGYTLQKTARLANISAAYNLLQYGPLSLIHI